MKNADYVAMSHIECKDKNYGWVDVSVLLVVHWT